MKTLTRVLAVAGLILFTGFTTSLESEREVVTEGDVAASIRAIGKAVAQRGGKSLELPAGSAGAAYTFEYAWLGLIPNGSEITVKAGIRSVGGCFHARDATRLDSLLNQLVNQASKDSGIPMHLKPEQGGGLPAH